MHGSHSKSSRILLLSLAAFFAGCNGCGSSGKGSSGSIGTSTPATPPAVTPVSSTAVTAQYFGMHVHNTNHWPSTSFGSLRLWDAGVTWPNLEPSKGQWNFATLDKFVALSEQSNVQVLMTLGFSPQWASARPNEACPYGPGEAAEPQDIQDWRDFIQAVATRYKGRIHEYDIWNEPSDPNFFTGTPAKMVELASEAYKILKQVDPTITVVTPGLPGDTGKTWLDTYLALGGGNYADVIGYHFYVNPDPPESITYMVSDVQAILKKYGQSSKPLWNTETGWHWPATFTPEQETGYVARSYLLSWGIGVSRFYWYAWDDQDWATLQMTNIDGSTRPAAQAFAVVRGWMLNSDVAPCSNANGIWTCNLSQGSVVSHVIWSQNGTATFSIPQSWKSTVMIDLSGQHSAVSPNATTVQIGPSPVWLGSGS